MFSSFLTSLPETFSSFRDFPAAADRSRWDELNETIRTRIIKEAEQYIGHTFAPIPAGLYMDFCRTGNRSRFEDVYFTRRTILNVLVLAECIEHRGRFLNDIINGIYAVLEESGWQLPAHNNYIRDTPQFILPDTTRPVLDLFACETGCQLSLIRYLLQSELDAVSPIICKRIRTELQNRIVTPYLNDIFWWMGYENQPTNNWTVWCTQNVLITVFMPDAEAPYAENTIRKAVITRAVYSLDRFTEEYGTDGCCSEGAQYYRHAALCLFNAMELLNAVTNGLFTPLYRNEKVINIAEYIVNMHVAGNWYFNFADCAAVISEPGTREYLFGKRCGSQRLMQYAADGWNRSFREGGITYVAGDTETLNLFYHLQELFTSAELIAAGSHQAEDADPIQKARHTAYPSTGTYICHLSNGTERQLSLAVKAGCNNDSHNHNDTGSFTLYKNGKPFIIDIGVETYSKKTFSPNRYDIWTMQSLYHNVTNFEKIQQKAGAAYKAEQIVYTPKETGLEISMELAAAYPENSGIKTYRRTVSASPDEITVTDTVQSERRAVFTLLTQEKPEYLQNGEHGKTVLSIGELGTVTFTETEVIIQEIPITDARLKKSWQGSIYRILVPYENTLTAAIR